MTQLQPDLEAADLCPSDFLMALIVALLAPMFLGVTGGDINLARLAALETVNGYRARSHADLIAIAQIIAFGFGALASLSLSMEDDVSVSMALRLRGNANALNRSAEQNRRVIREAVPEPASPVTEMTAADLRFEAETLAQLEEVQQLLAEAQGPRKVQAVQSEPGHANTVPNTVSAPLLPTQPKTTSHRASMLCSTASQLMAGRPPGS